MTSSILRKLMMGHHRYTNNHVRIIVVQISATCCALQLSRATSSDLIASLHGQEATAQTSDLIALTTTEGSHPEKRNILTIIIARTGATHIHTYNCIGVVVTNDVVNFLNPLKVLVPIVSLLIERVQCSTRSSTSTMYRGLWHD